MMSGYRKFIREKNKMENITLFPHKELPRLNYKTCSKCKKQMTLSSFDKDKCRPDGLNKWCRVCKKENRIKNCQKPKVYIKRKWDGFGKKDHKHKRFRASREITFPELWSCLQDFCKENVKEGKHPYACAYTGKTMTFIQGKGQIETNLSVDRIDNNKPYTKDNITFCTNQFNKIKGEATVDSIKKILVVFKKKNIKYEME